MAGFFFCHQLCPRKLPVQENSFHLKTASDLPTSPDSSHVFGTSRRFHENSHYFKEWCFSAELALRGNNIQEDHQATSWLHISWREKFFYGISHAKKADYPSAIGNSRKLWRRCLVHCVVRRRAGLRFSPCVRGVLPKITSDTSPT